mgnify:FL=1
MMLTEYTVEFANVKKDALHVDLKVCFVSARNEFDAVEQATNILSHPNEWVLTEVNEV